MAYLLESTYVSGQIVSIFAESSARGVIVDGGVMTVGAAAAARGVSAPMQELKYIYEHSGSVGAFIDNAKGMTEFLKIMVTTAMCR